MGVLNNTRKYLLLLLVAIIVVSFYYFLVPNAKREVRKLERIFPILEVYHVEAFRDQDWCSVFEYSRGAYATNVRSTCIYLLNSEPKEFDSVAQADFDIVKNAIEKRVGSNVIIISHIEYVEGKVKSAVFDYGFFSGFDRLVYNPGYSLPEDIPNEMEHTRINEEWYSVWEDWN
jgi:hypothetical protein